MFNIKTFSVPSLPIARFAALFMPVWLVKYILVDVLMIFLPERKVIEKLLKNKVLNETIVEINIQRCCFKLEV